MNNVHKGNNATLHDICINLTKMGYGVKRHSLDKNDDGKNAVNVLDLEKLEKLR